MEFYVFDPDFEMMQFQPRRSCRRSCSGRPRFHNPWEQFMVEEPRRAQPMDLGATLTVLDSLAKAFNKELNEGENKMPTEGEAKKDESKKGDEKPSEVMKTSNDIVPEAPKNTMKRFGTKVAVSETMEKTDITIELLGHKFKPEDLEVQVIDGNILLVKAEGQPKFERRFNLPAKSLVDKIESIFNNREEDKQTLLIKIPKEVQVVQVPISLMEE